MPVFAARRLTPSDSQALTATWPLVSGASMQDRLASIDIGLDACEHPVSRAGFGRPIPLRAPQIGDLRFAAFHCDALAGGAQLGRQRPQRGEPPGDIRIVPINDGHRRHGLAGKRHRIRRVSSPCTSNGWAISLGRVVQNRREHQILLDAENAVRQFRKTFSDASCRWPSPNGPPTAGRWRPTADG